MRSRIAVSLPVALMHVARADGVFSGFNKRNERWHLMIMSGLVSFAIGLIFVGLASCLYFTLCPFEEEVLGKNKRRKQNRLAPSRNCAVGCIICCLIVFQLARVLDQSQYNTEALERPAPAAPAVVVPKPPLCFGDLVISPDGTRCLVSHIGNVSAPAVIPTSSTMSPTAPPIRQRLTRRHRRVRRPPCDTNSNFVLIRDGKIDYRDNFCFDLRFSLQVT
jgi:hypothetical protein